MAVLSYSVIIENRIAKTGYTRKTTNLRHSSFDLLGVPASRTGLREYPSNLIRVIPAKENSQLVTVVTGFDSGSAPAAAPQILWAAF